MNCYMKQTVLLIASVLGMVAQATIPEAIQKTWVEMKSNDVESRAGFNKSLGVYVIARGAVR